MRLLPEFIPPEVIPFVWFGGIVITVYVFFHKFSDVIKEKFRQTNLHRRKEERTGNTDGQIDDLIKNAPRILCSQAISKENYRFYREHLDGISGGCLNGR